MGSICLVVQCFFFAEQGKDMFFDDGQHYGKGKGHYFIAKSFLEFLGVENAPDNFTSTKENDEIFELEKLETVFCIKLQSVKYKYLIRYVFC